MSIKTLLVSAALGGSAASSLANPTTGDTARATKLIGQARALSDVHPDEAEVAARAALLVETSKVPAELLVAIAWGESRFVPTTMTGRACGLVQVVARSRGACELLKIPVVGMLVGRIELEEWLRLSRGNLRLALLGNACGMSAFDGSCIKTAWPSWVLARARRLGFDLDVGPRS
jgi:hypothetical protein